jgi:lipoate-protein ligase A
MSNHWCIIETGPREPAWNMALDEALLEAVNRGEIPPVLRFYDWTIPTVSIGFHQKLDHEVDFNRIQERGYAAVRRPTGGRAVLHKNEVTYAVIAPVTGLLAGNVTDTYARISLALVEGLQLLGVPAELEEGHPAESKEPGNPCFTSVSRFELTVRGKKIVGSAQLRRGTTLLQHGSIQLHADQAEMADLLPDLDDRQRERFARYLRLHSTSIDAECGRVVSYDEAVSALHNGFSNTWETNEFQQGIGEELEALPGFSSLLSKYVNSEWNRH